jgi:hypothetical protein
MKRFSIVKLKDSTEVRVLQFNGDTWTAIKLDAPLHEQWVDDYSFPPGGGVRAGESEDYNQEQHTGFRYNVHHEHVFNIKPSDIIATVGKHNYQTHALRGESKSNIATRCDGTSVKYVK